MAAPRPNGSIDIWNFVDNVTGTTVRKWLRDSWARRKIVALQQAVANIVVPTKTSQLQNDSGFITQADVPPGSTASSTTPLMDGTAAVGTENAFARGDHRHPTDTSRQAALSTAQMAAVNSGVTAAKVAAYDAIEVPTKTSELTNDSGFVTASAIPTETSDLVNDSGFITAADIPAIPSKTSDLTNDSGYITASSVPSAYASNPLMDGTASAGSSTAWARGDHRHPTDTSRQAALSTAQLAAVNSGVTAAKVQEWDSIEVPTKTSELTNDSGFITSVPVQSVNGKTGAVNLGAADVGALPDTTVIPSKTSQLTNDSGFLTSAPVTSVNGKTGTVNLTASDVGALPSNTAIPSKTSDLTNDSGYITSADLPSVPLPSTASPKMDGTASAGSSAAWSRGDHVHPHDTSKADKATTLAGYGITNAYTKTEVNNLIPTVPTNISAFTNDAGYVTASSVPDASTATPSMDGTGAAGSSADYARADHVHPHDTSKQDALTVSQLAAVNSGITADNLAVNDASVLCTVTPIEPELLEPCYHSNTYGRCWYYKIGHHVHLHVGISGLTSGTTADVFYLPEGYRPHSILSNTGTGTSMTNYSRLRIQTDGRVFINANATSACVDIEFDAFQ